MAETLKPLVEAAQEGDREALNELAGCVDRFVRIFHGSLSKSVRLGYGSTIDFVVEGIAESLNKLDAFEYRSDEEFYAWVAVHIRNRIRGTGRAAHSQKRGARPAALDAVAEVAANAPSVSMNAQSAEMRDAVGHALLDLQRDYPQEMEVVLMKVFEERTWPQIRAGLGLSSDKRARTLFAKGVERLRPAVEERLGPDAFGEMLGV